MLPLRRLRRQRIQLEFNVCGHWTKVNTGHCSGRLLCLKRTSRVQQSIVRTGDGTGDGICFTGIGTLSKYGLCRIVKYEGSAPVLFAFPKELACLFNDHDYTARMAVWKHLSIMIINNILVIIRRAVVVFVVVRHETSIFPSKKKHTLFPLSL